MGSRGAMAMAEKRLEDSLAFIVITSKIRCKHLLAARWVGRTHSKKALASLPCLAVQSTVCGTAPGPGHFEMGSLVIPLNNLAEPSSFWRGVRQMLGDKQGVCFRDHNSAGALFYQRSIPYG